MSEPKRFARMFNKSIGFVRKWSEIKVGSMLVAEMCMCLVDG